jgi:peptidoglycan hydrolase-like protein with peptidoglycan-binding domain
MITPPRTLRPASLHTRGPEVAAVQRLLGIEADGEFGPITAAAVTAWKRARGDRAPTPDLTPADRRRLLADVPLRAVRKMERWAADGLAERPRGSDYVPELVELARRLEVAPAYREMGYPWCSFAAFLAALAAGGETASAGLRRQAFNPLYAPALLTAANESAFGLCVVPARNAFRGDLVLFDWNFAAGDPADHVARLTRLPAGGRIQTVDGNSGANGLLALRERPAAAVRAFARDS